MIRSQQQQSNQEGQAAEIRLCNMEIQFKRIDDLDTKVAAIQGDLSSVNNQLSIAAQTQQQLSHDLQSLQNHTSSQFAALSNNGVATMESQHSLSTLMLDLRSQFSQMSRLMQDLSNKLEVTMRRRAAESHIPYGNQAEGYHLHQPPQAQPATSQAAGTSELSRKLLPAMVQKRLCHHGTLRHLKQILKHCLKYRNMIHPLCQRQAPPWMKYKSQTYQTAHLQPRRSIAHLRSRKKRQRNKTMKTPSAKK